MIEINDEMIATHSGYRLTIALIEENRELKAENEQLKLENNTVRLQKMYAEESRKAIKAENERLIGICEETQKIIIELCQTFGVPVPQSTIDRIHEALKGSTDEL